MPAEIITREDLAQLKTELLTELKDLLTEHCQPPRRWLRSSEVRQMLNISPGTLQNLRVNGHIPYSPIGSSVFYPHDEIEKILQANLQNKP